MKRKNQGTEETNGKDEKERKTEKQRGAPVVLGTGRAAGGGECTKAAYRFSQAHEAGVERPYRGGCTLGGGGPPRGDSAAVRGKHARHARSAWILSQPPSPLKTGRVHTVLLPRSMILHCSRACPPACVPGVDLQNAVHSHDGPAEVGPAFTASPPHAPCNVSMPPQRC